MHKNMFQIMWAWSPITFILLSVWACYISVFILVFNKPIMEVVTFGFYIEKEKGDRK